MNAIDRRRERLAAAWKLDREVVLIAAGEPVSIPGGADQTYPYLSHSDYYWLTERETPGGVLAFDPAEGWTDFVPPTSVAERVWEGREDAPGVAIDGLAGWLASRRGRPIVMLGAPLPGARSDAALAETLAATLLHARRPKDASEIERLRRASAATARGFAAVHTHLRAGVSERQLQIELEAEFFRGGADGVGYGTIVGFGDHAAVLHFTPTDRIARAGDAVLIDAGAQIARYTADVTRTYRVPGAPRGFLEDLHAVVLGVEERAIARCVRGAEWRDIHLAAAHELAGGLVELDILTGKADGLVERDTHALFFPHGLGHLCGLGVRDASGYLPGRARSTRPGLANLRTDLPLEPGYMITVEPGIYFIRALLTNRENREKHAGAVKWTRVDELLDIGGVRIEDDVLVTDGAPDVLSRGDTEVDRGVKAGSGIPR